MQMYTLGALLAEDASDNGIGTAMCRLMARGSGKYSFADISEYFDATGGAFGTSMGSNTFSVSATCLKENAEKSFDIFKDVALNPAFDKEELEKIRPQMLAAVDRATEDWAGEAMKFAKEKYYKDSPYKLLAVGSRDEIAKVTPEDIRKHYETYFRNPEKTVIAIYGDIDVAKMEAAVQGFAEMPKHEAKLATVSDEGTPGTYLNPTKKETATVIIGYGPGMTITSKDKDAMMLVQTIMGGYSSALGSPLFETLRGKGLVYTVQAGNAAGPVKGMFLILALGEPQNADEIVKIISQIVDDTKAGKLFTDELIAKAQDQAITGEQLQGVTIADSATSQALDELMGLGYDYKKTFAARMKAVTREDLLRVANRYLTDPVVTITTPAAK
jgi:zinc protease